jgi:hypothetical protein
MMLALASLALFCTRKVAKMARDVLFAIFAGQMKSAEGKRKNRWHSAMSDDNREGRYMYERTAADVKRQQKDRRQVNL